jgi:hypothetical protein
MLAILRKGVAHREPAAKLVAVFADPVFESTDSRFKNNHADYPRPEKNLQRSLAEVLLTNNGSHIPRLPFTRREADDIVSMVPPSTEWKHLTLMLICKQFRALT